jgi:hypothetical protein
MDVSGTYDEHFTYCATARKQDIRRSMRDLFLRGEATSYDATGHDWLLGVKASADRDAEECRANLFSGAFRRAEIHDDPGSADQMLFCAAVIAVFGPRGLLF